MPIDRKSAKCVRGIFVLFASKWCLIFVMQLRLGLFLFTQHYLINYYDTENKNVSMVKDFE